MPSAERPQDRSWTRAQVLRDARFYGSLPGLFAAPFVITGVLLHQVHLIETKAWTLSSFAACYPLYAASATAVVAHRSPRGNTTTAFLPSFLS